MRSTIMNAVPMLILHTPLLHRLMSSHYLVLEFTGRKSGRLYRTPVAYRAEGSELTFTTDSRWWRNVAATPEVGLVLRGHRRRGIARQVTDLEVAASDLGRLVEDVPGYRRAAGLHAGRDGKVAEAELHRAVAADRKAFRIGSLR